MDPSMSDISGTSTMTPGSAAIARSLAQGKKKPYKAKTSKVTPTPPKAARKLEPYRPKSSLSASSPVFTPSSPPKQVQSSFSLKGMFTPDSTVDPPSTLDDSTMTGITTIKEEEPWDIEFSDTKRTKNTAVKDVKKPLNMEKDSYIENYIPSDDDIDSLADIDGGHIKISPYPGSTNFGPWLESQFPTIIPNGTAMFLEQLDILSEADLYYWISLKAKDYLKILGPDQYDRI
jgi:hypothetical protein